MFKKCVIVFISTFFLIGCSNVTGKESFFENIEAMEIAAQEENWSSLQTLFTELDELYKTNEWKVQLLGDESEYETLQESMDRLAVSIEEEDSLQTKLELSTIKTLLTFIYSL